MNQSRREVSLDCRVEDAWGMLTRTPDALGWLHGRLQHVPHALGEGIAIFYVELPSNAIVPSEAVGLDEVSRAGRMRDSVEGLHFLASRALQRSLLAIALRRECRGLDLSTDDHGKPRLAGELLRFNMSRSGSSVLLAISESLDVGVDIEQVRELQCLDALARAHLAHDEYATWQRGAPGLAHARFLEFWTRKEACVKAAGVGLAMPLASVGVGCGARAAPIAVAFGSGKRGWRGRVVSLPMRTGLVAAAAVTT